LIDVLDFKNQVELPSSIVEPVQIENNKHTFSFSTSSGIIHSNYELNDKPIQASEDTQIVLVSVSSALPK
jgi:hypothetical protein